MRYIDFMYEVLVYVYENYWGGDACPDREQLGRRLTSAGFEREEIVQALTWLDGLYGAAPADGVREGAQASLALEGRPDSVRVYSETEMTHLGAAGISCLHFLQASGALSAPLREVVIERALAVPESPIDLGVLKLIVMMVYWRFGASPDVLILDELCDDADGRLAH